MSFVRVFPVADIEDFNFQRTHGQLVIAHAVPVGKSYPLFLISRLAHIPTSEDWTLGLKIGDRQISQILNIGRQLKQLLACTLGQSDVPCTHGYGQYQLLVLFAIVWQGLGSVPQPLAPFPKQFL